MKLLSQLAMISTVVGILSSCVTQNQDYQKFQAVKIGMMRIQAEAFVGKPIIDEQQLFTNLPGNLPQNYSVYYGGPPKVKPDPLSSPQSMTSIVLVYSTNNVVLQKFFYGNKE